MPFDKRLFLILFIGIFFSTIAGILFHEFGHWAAYRYYGYNARIGYAHTGMQANDVMLKHHLIELEYANKIDSNLDFQKKAEYEKLGKILQKETIIIGAAGPVVTLLSTAIAIILLFIQRKKRDNNKDLLPGQWVLICVALFCIRGLVNLRTTLTAIFFGTSYGHSDEAKLSRTFGWYEGSLPLITETITITALLLLICYIVPKQQRLTFFAALLFGELAVVFLWLMLLGPKLLP